MARLWYGGTLADLAISQGAEAEILDSAEVGTGTFGTAALLPIDIEDVAFEVFVDVALANQTTDLLDADNAAMTTVVPEDSFAVRGEIPRFQGPDGHEGPLWLSPDGEVGFRLEPESDLLYDRVGVIETGVGVIEADIDAVESDVVSLNGRLDTLEAVPPVDFQRFESDGTWTKPVGAVRVLVEVQAGGAAGGGVGATGVSQAAEGGGGGGGGYGAKWFDASSLGATEDITVGASVSGTSGANGGNGNPSEFGTAHFGANGGTGGTAMAATAGPTYAAGGAGGGVFDSGSGLPPIIREGGDGCPGMVVATAVTVRQNAGGSSRSCGMQRLAASTTSSVGSGGLNGGGGSGGRNGASVGAKAGGDGDNGYVQVTTFF
jgi:hypothetical protein